MTISKIIRKVKGKNISLAIPQTNEESLTKYIEWDYDDEIIKFMGGQRNITNVEEEEKYFSNTCDYKWVFIIVTNDNTEIGICDVTKNNPFSATISIMIGDSDYRDKGNGTEALQLLLSYCFNSLGFHRVELVVYEENERAIHMYEKVGFKKSGILRELEWYNGKWRNMIVMDILAHEFYES